MKYSEPPPRQSSLLESADPTRPVPSDVQAHAITQLMASLARFRGEDVFNPWGQVCEVFDRDPQAPKHRRQRLKAHLWTASPRWLLCAEAAGYQGARYSGVTFTSEAQLLAGTIPRVELAERITTRPRPFSEPSATIVWRALWALNIASDVVMWNAFPFHPVGKERAPLSNRTPTQAELDVGRRFLARMLDIFPRARLVAVGRKSAETLTRLGYTPAAQVRHPANGGATQFREGLARLVGQGQ